MQRIQIQLEDKRLDDVVGEMAQAVVGSTDGMRIQAARIAIRSVMEKYVHAYDTCGLASVCKEGSEIDPWEGRAQDED